MHAQDHAQAFSRRGEQVRGGAGGKGRGKRKGGRERGGEGGREGGYAPRVTPLNPFASTLSQVSGGCCAADLLSMIRFRRPMHSQAASKISCTSAAEPGERP